MEETLEIIRLLWKSDGFVDYDGDHFDLDDAHLYTKFDEPPETHVAASGPSTVKLTSEYGDGFITVKTGEEFIERLYPAVRSYTEDEGRDPDEMGHGTQRRDLASPALLILAGTHGYLSRLEIKG